MNLAPAQLLASKVFSFAGRRGRPKSGTDWRDPAMLLLVFPELKSDVGPVREQLEKEGAAPKILAAWTELVAQEFAPEDED